MERPRDLEVPPDREPGWAEGGTWFPPASADHSVIMKFGQHDAGPEQVSPIKTAEYSGAHRQLGGLSVRCLVI